MSKQWMACLAITVFLIPFSASTAPLEVGKLDCDISSGVGMIIETKQTVSCTFTPSPSFPGPALTYKGSIDEFGLAIGDVKAGRMIWLVSSVNGQPFTGLQGTYRGVDADASLGLGGGAKILVGGSQDSLSLQPLSLEGEEGVNVAIGVASLKLSAVE
ncbi:hypothetical protein ATY81_01110 [Rhizobium sp. R72]|uniref:DUF992 domain-containing protein n=1 Tax=unclassified Rhizobium TaxID=2613769 RepID=UPI000B52977B|nr:MULTISPECIES: DUF992 domain-containing protein [unclassified Rhizobium]OWW04615.1 hypothetical protein ATY81_01110 [Rhizobium sp. R72]OWW05672.1 hypothetical protein ATY80_01110 [Rhizobium sp. R711]